MSVCLCVNTPYRVVCLLVTFASPAKIAELIKMSFEWGGVNRVGPYALDGGSIYQGKGSVLGVVHTTENVGSLCSSLHKNGRTDRDAIWRMTRGLTDGIKVGQVHSLM